MANHMTEMTPRMWLMCLICNEAGGEMQECRFSVEGCRRAFAVQKIGCGVEVEREF